MSNRNDIGTNLDEIRNLLDLQSNYVSSSKSLEFAWYVGATGNDSSGKWHDFSDTYINEGRWKNGVIDDIVRTMQVGDRIALKSTSKQKYNLPFNNNGKEVGFADIKAIGTITENLNDGQNIKVNWTRFDDPKRWYSFCGFLRNTVCRVAGTDGASKRALLDFTFGDVEQDYSLCEEKYIDETQDVIVDCEELTLEQLATILRDMCQKGESEGQKVSAIYNFGIIYGKVIKEKYKASEIIKVSGLNQVYDRELQKAINIYSTIVDRTFGLRFASKDAIALDIMQENEVEEAPEAYNKTDFLSDVFMDENEYETLKKVLEYKKNIILQGSPGVGKTYLAKRFVYSLMGETDSSRVQLVQFHQNYSYEEFIMGYKPKNEGFKLENGVFYDFCKKAEKDTRDYYFIIDEINRGNVSKIFGELMMLIEGDKRGIESARLAYRDEKFCVPKNVYIIGMMNTADRSLAIMDYALRRRFSFFEINPAFEKNSFAQYLKKNSVSDTLVKKIVRNFSALNAYIADEKNSGLGSGFRIGHSYFCDAPNCEESMWYDNIIKFEIKPMLEEYWFDEKDKADEWIGKIK